MTDEAAKESLHPIGALAKLVQISTDTLRYYDEIGLVKPAYISEQTGYRYYSDGQAKHIAQIMELKQYGFSLEEIKHLLDDDGKPPEGLFHAQYKKLLSEMRRLQNAAERLEKKFLSNKEDAKMEKRILLVDDASFMRMMCRDILTRAGYTVVGEAEDGYAAVEKYSELKPDVVLMNIVMPNRDGIEAVRFILSADAHARIVMCSAMGQARITAEAILAGAKDFIVKPFQPDKLLSAISNALNTSRDFNYDVLLRVHSLSKNDTRILSQDDLDNLIRLASSGSAVERDADVWLHDLQAVVAEPVEIPETLQERSTQALLQKVLDGQEEIKTLLKQIVVK